MGRVRKVEELLERLSGLEASLSGNGEAGTAPLKESASAAPEKKTLISEIPPAVSLPAVDSSAVEPERPVAAAQSPSNPSREFRTEPEEAPWDHSYDPTVEPDFPAFEAAPEPEPEPQISSPKIDLSFLDSMPVKLPPMDPEELEHVEDTWLDNAYELKLARSGDSLMPFPNIGQIVAAISPNAATPNGSAAGNGNGNGTAAAIAADFINRVPEPEFISDEIPELPENATDEQLLEFAQNHPTVKRVLKVFRGKIIDVRRT
jgi:hypothetical protein